MKTFIKNLANTFLSMGLIFAITTVKTFGQTAANVNQYGLAFNPTDAFNFKGNSVPFYGLGWYSEMPNTPPMAYFSGYSGIKFFAEGQPRMFMDIGGNLGLGTSSPHSRLHIAGGDERIFLGDYNNSNDTKGIYFPGFRDIVPNYFGASIEATPEWICCGGFPAATGYPGIRNMGIQFNVHDDAGIADSKLTAMAINSNGNVGIGIKSPAYKLNISQDILMNNDMDIAQFGVSGSSDPAKRLIIGYDMNGAGFGFIKAGWFQHQWTSLALQPNGGNVGIGITNPAEKLAVNGNIRSKEVRVEAANWPDYVFDENYKVGKLEELESYIKTNKHLPEMPTAKDVEVNGVALGEMNELLLKKVEELTLHLIEQQKQLNEQGKLIKTLQQESSVKK